MTKTRLVLALAFLLLATPSSVPAQTPRDMMELGVRAYRDLEWSAAGALLVRALADSSEQRLTPWERVLALTYLGAIKVLGGESDSAAVVFRELILLDPRYQPDELIFPPEVTYTFAAVRNGTKAVVAEVPGQFEFRAGEDRFPLSLLATSPHEIRAEISREPDVRVRVLYVGSIEDSLRITWDGRDAQGRPLDSGSYVLRVVSIDAAGQPSYTVRLPMDVRLQQQDTLPLPLPPADSLFLTERTSAGAAGEALFGGLLAAAAVVLLPEAIVPGVERTGAHLSVAGLLTLGGIAGFLANRPGQVMAENVEYNEGLRRAFQESFEAVAQENARRRADVRLTIRTGEPTVVRQREGR